MEGNASKIGDGSPIDATWCLHTMEFILWYGCVCCWAPWANKYTYSKEGSWTKEVVDLGCLCTSYCLIGRIFGDYFSCVPLWLIRWFVALVAFVLYCFPLFALFVELKFSSPVSLLFSPWHWAQSLYYVAFPLNFSPWHWAQECLFVVYLNRSLSWVMRSGQCSRSCNVS